MIELQCPECSYDLTSQFEVNSKNGKVKPNRAILTCPDCLTKIKTLVDKDEQLLSLQPINRIIKPLPLGKIIESTYLGQESKQEMYERLFDQVEPIECCMVCQQRLNIFTALLVRVQTDIFPKIVNEISTFSPANKPVIELKTTYLPPVKEKGKMCQKCYDKLAYKGGIEILPEPRNMVRDGIRPNVVNVFAPSREPDFETPKETTEYDLSKISGVWDEPIIEGFDFSRRKDERRMGVSKEYHGIERRKVERRKTLQFEIAVNVKGKPSHRVRDFREDKTPAEVKGFHRPNIERRAAFKKIIREAL